MKLIFRLGAFLTLLVCFATLPAKAALDISETLMLERYTVTNGWMVRLDTGNLLKNGTFRVLLSEIVNPIYYNTAADFTPYSGRPLMSEQLYTAYKTLGIIPKWTRSRDAFAIGYDTYVIVGIADKKDPNPTIIVTAQPESQRVLLGDWVSFSVDAEPFEHMSYQWMLKNKPLPGKVNSWFYVAGAKLTDAGIYTVSMNTGGKSVKSKKALLQVVTPVSVKTQPKSQTVKTGKNATFRVALSGTGPFNYLWCSNGVAIPNATKSYYTVSKVQPVNGGTYAVIVGNGLSTAVSSNAVLTVSP